MKMLEMVQQAVLAFEPGVTETVRLEGRELPLISNESQEKTLLESQSTSSKRILLVFYINAFFGWFKCCCLVSYNSKSR